MQDNDLISRATAIDYLMTNMVWHDADGYEVDDADEKRAIITDLVNGIPAVDAEPVRHGRWIPTVIYMNTPDYYACSVCGHEIAEEFTSAIPVPYVYKFCPNCGAKMDGGGDHADG